VLPEIVPDTAVIIEVPAASPDARPLVLSTVATAVVPDVQVTDVVISTIVASEYVPMAVNCCVVSLAIDGLAGVTEMDTSGAAVTVNSVLPEIVPDTAVIVEVPAATPVARPLVLSTVATAVVPDVQVTNVVMSNDVPSE
jgi:hypothetical protein